MAAGFTDPAVRRIAKAIGKAESDGFTDAVGDIPGALLGPYVSFEAAQADYAGRQRLKQQVPVPVEYEQRADGWYAYNSKWGPSVGWFQVRSLRKPEMWGTVDRLRVAELLRDPLYNAKAAFAISKGGTDFSFWSVYNHETYLKFLDVDYQLKTGHARADDWDI